MRGNVGITEAIIALIAVVSLFVILGTQGAEGILLGGVVLVVMGLFVIAGRGFLK